MLLVGLALLAGGVVFTGLGYWDIARAIDPISPGQTSWLILGLFFGPHLTFFGIGTIVAAAIALSLQRQFTIRTLLAAIGLVAVACFVWLYGVQPWLKNWLTLDQDTAIVRMPNERIANPGGRLIAFHIDGTFAAIYACIIMSLPSIALLPIFWWRARSTSKELTASKAS
jgi:hypothetical protein